MSKPTQKSLSAFMSNKSNQRSASNQSSGHLVKGDYESGELSRKDKTNNKERSGVGNRSSADSAQYDRTSMFIRLFAETFIKYLLIIAILVALGAALIKVAPQIIGFIRMLLAAIILG